MKWSKYLGMRIVVSLVKFTLELLALSWDFGAFVVCGLGTLIFRM
jgi:hypothetical protein